MVDQRISRAEETLQIAAKLVDEQRGRVHRQRALHSPLLLQSDAVLASFEHSLEVMNYCQSAMMSFNAPSGEETGIRPAAAAPAARTRCRIAKGTELERIQELRVDEAKARIAQALHDELGQQLALLKLSLRDFSMASKRADLAELAMHEVHAKVDMAISTVRRIAFDLTPAALRESPLPEALESLVSEFTQKSQCIVRCDVVPETASFSEQATLAIYRIVQEALTNVLRHARAHHVNILLYRRGENYLLRIADDGEGAADPLRPPVRSLGLSGINERVHLLRGRVTIDSSPGNGFTILISLPRRSLTAFDGGPCRVESDSSVQDAINGAVVNYKPSSNS